MAWHHMVRTFHLSYSLGELIFLIKQILCEAMHKVNRRIKMSMIVMNSAITGLISLACTGTDTLYAGFDGKLRWCSHRCSEALVSISTTTTVSQNWRIDTLVSQRADNLYDGVYDK